MNVAIQILSYKEPHLSATLDAYADLSIPTFVDDIEYHAAITPRDELRESAPGVDPDPVVARMVEQAEAHETFGLLRTPPGKLPSRNEAHDIAASRGADVIVVGDADAPPLHEDYLHELLAPFEAGEVAATNARPMASWTRPFGFTTNFLGFLDDRIRPHMHGQGHALSAEAWIVVGPFATDFDLTNSRRVRAEEEYGFRHRLAEYAPVVDVWSARVYNDTRRSVCMANKSVRASWQPPGGPFCERLRDSHQSGVTFQPRQR